jgi:hypothetical protein
LGFLGRLSLKLRPGKARGVVQDGSLDIAANAISLDDSLCANAIVKDAFSTPGCPPLSLFKVSRDPGEQACTVRQVDLVRNTDTFDLQLPDEGRASIRQINIKIAAICRQSLHVISDAEVLDLETPYNHPPPLRDGGRFLLADPPVRQLTAKMSELPLAQKTVKVQELPDSERSGFLHEAEVLKGIPADQAELLAVFRHVPIEVISRLRFLEERKAILYSLARETQLTKTRVHDMAAVRDQRSREIHLVPHRSRFKSVALN